jgi:NAD(P)-dependent dehydrogenase (short-subunit alcohol dehydrogenase family)
MQQDPLFQLADRIILVTGAAGGLGSAISRALAERGARLVLTDIRADAVNALADECGTQSNVEAQGLDILDEEAVETTVEQILAQHGRLDGLINAAGIFRIAPIAQMSSKDFLDSVAINLTGPFYLTRAAARTMRANGGGRVLHLASVSSLVANPDYAAYASSKAALSHMIRVAARELAADGVTVNAIGQAVTETPLMKDVLADPQNRTNIISQIPMGRLCTPDDILAMVILLMSPGGTFITGQTMYVDGGRTLV